MTPSDDLRDLYQDLVLDHSRTPRNFRTLENANRHAEGDNPLCGDRVALFLRLGDDGRIEDVAFQGQGCAISTASSSILTTLIKGKTPEDAEQLVRYVQAKCSTRPGAPEPSPPFALSSEEATRLEALAGVRAYPMRVKCATLAWHALRRALAEKVGPSA